MEEYFNGAGVDSAFDVRSVTKSVLSLLVGIALDEGYLTSLDEPIGPRLAAWVPGLPEDKRAITIRHLLTMTSGIPWNELGTTEQDYSPFVSSPDPLRWILERPLERPPGTYWHYNTGACHILSAVLTQAVSLPAREYAQRKLFGPLDTEVRGWVVDPQGYDYGGHGISLSASALVKLGRLMLDGGRYRNRSIVPAEWIRTSTQQLFFTNEAVPWGTHYGYLWWSGRDSRTGLSFSFATGYGGQFVVLVPDRNTTIVATTAWYGVPDAGANWSLVLRTIVEQVLPGLR
jgi:CubicO group peptidase (beta-lactamase class C family)